MSRLYLFCMRKFSCYDVLDPLCASVFCNQHVDRRQEEQGEQGADRHAANEHQADRVSGFGAGAGDKGERKVPGDSRDGRHEHRTQADLNDPKGKIRP